MTSNEISNEITNIDLDILGEIGNIGAGNAATALSQIINKPVLMEVPMAQLYDLKDIPEILGGVESIRTCIFFKTDFALDGYILFVLKDEDAENLRNIVANGYDIDTFSVLSEISNIITGAYVGAISTMIDDKIDITPPQIGHDMVGSLLDSIISVLYSVADQAVIIGTTLVIDGETIEGHYIFMLERDSLEKLLNYFKK